MNDSSEPVDRRITRTPRTGCSRSACARATSTPTELRLSLAPGTTSRLPMSAIAAAAPAEKSRPRRRRPAPPRAAAQRGEHRAEEHAEHDREALVRRLVQPRVKRIPSRGSAGWKTRPAVRGVVVGDEHERPLRIAVARLGHHVPGRAVGQHRAAEPQPPAARVVPHGRGGERAHQRRERAAPRERGQQAGGVQEPDRPPIAPVGRLGLDPGLASGGAQLGGHHLRAPALPLGCRGALERAELADHPLDQGAAHRRRQRLGPPVSALAPRPPRSRSAREQYVTSRQAVAPRRRHLRGFRPRPDAGVPGSGRGRGVPDRVGSHDERGTPLGSQPMPGRSGGQRPVRAHGGGQRPRRRAR